MVAPGPRADGSFETQPWAASLSGYQGNSVGPPSQNAPAPPARLPRRGPGRRAIRHFCDGRGVLLTAEARARAAQAGSRLVAFAGPRPKLRHFGAPVSFSPSFDLIWRSARLEEF